MSYYSKPELKIVRASANFVVAKVPFAMKDSFKAAFPKARWNRNETAWSVPLENEAKLTNWIEEHDDAYQQVLAEYEELKSAHEAAEAEEREAEERARMVHEIEVRKHRAKLAEGQTEFARHASVQSAISAFDRVCRGAEIPKAWARAERNEGRDELVEIQAMLRAAGLDSKGIREMRKYNLNRISKAEASSARAELFLLEPYSPPTEDD